jgi:hypothetical protein
MSDGQPRVTGSDVEQIRQAITKARLSPRRRAFEKFFLAALGSIPWVGGFLSVAAELKLQEHDTQETSLQSQWLQEHARKLEELSETMEQTASRFEALGEQIDERLQSEEYLDVVRRAFRAWDRADTNEKRGYIGLLIANASATSLQSS